MQVLQVWQEQLHDAARVDQTLGHLHGVLAMRNGEAGRTAGTPSLQQVVAQVQQLVEGEARVQATHDAFASVENELRSNPQGGLQQVVRHFQDLFGVASIEGCLPMMSKVCRFCACSFTLSPYTLDFFAALWHLETPPQSGGHPMWSSMPGGRECSGFSMHTNVLNAHPKSHSSCHTALESSPRQVFLPEVSHL